MAHRRPNGEQRDADADRRDGVADRRDDVAEQRDQAADQRDTDAGRRDTDADQLDDLADESDVVSRRRDAHAERRDDLADESDADAQQRDDDAEHRDGMAADRDSESARRDDDGDDRDAAAEERDAAARVRDREADERDRLADQYDREAVTSHLDSAGGLNGSMTAQTVSSLHRQRSVADRRRARDDRAAAARERCAAAADRAIARADRQAGADGRGESGRERDTSLADRVAALTDRTDGADRRGSSGLDRNTALADRVAGASRRGSSGLDRDTALADRVAGAGGRDWAILDRGATVGDRAASAVDRQSAAAYAALELRMVESEARAWRLLQAVPDPVVVIDANGIIELINVQAIVLFGYQSDELVGQPVERLLPTGLHDAHRRHRRSYVAADEPSSMSTGPNIVAVRKNGSTVPVEVNLSAITLSTGRAVLASIRDVSERKLSEAELRISDERFRVSFDLAPIGMGLIDLKGPGAGRFLRVNKSLCALTGYSEAELLERSTVAITHPADRAATAANLQRLADGGAARWNTDKRYHTKSGKDVWVHFAISVVHDAGGTPSYGVSQVEDITDRKDTEARLQEQFQELANNVDIGFVVRRLDPPEILYFNPAYRAILGFDPVGRTPALADARALIGAEGTGVIDSLVARAGKGERVEQEWPFTRPDGEARWVSGRLSPIIDTDGRIRRIIGLFEDITDRRTAEAVLAESQEQFGELANNVDVGFSIREPGNPTYLYLNSAYLTIFGFDPGAPWPTLDQVLAHIHPADIHRRADSPVDVPNGRTTDEWRLLIPGGADRWIRGNTFPVLDTDGHTRRVVGVVEDITDAKAAENALLAARAEAERANAAKTEFLSRMSHELRTPLNAILGFGQLMQMDDLSVEQHDGVRHILRAGEHLLGLIDEILDIARVETGAIRLSLEPVSVADVVERTVGMMAPLAAHRRVRIVVDDAGLDTHVLADHQRFKQVVVNILANAVKYNQVGGQVRIECEPTTAGRFRLTVNDTGIGIAEQDLGRLFQPFERLAAELSDVEGTGLGLALTKRLITDMGGQVGVRSRIGQGSAFWVELPTSEAPFATRPERADPKVGTETVPGGHRTVLYIEDNLSNVRLLEQIVARRPEVTLVVAMQGRIGLDLAIAHQPDLILLDLHLPDLSGEEVLRRLRADPRTATTPIVILSADATADQPKRLMAQGATSYLTKPFSVPTILGVIDRLDVASGPQAQSAAGWPVVDIGLGGRPGGDVGDETVGAKTGEAADLTTFVHDLINMLGVILTYSDLLAHDATQPATITRLEQQRTAAERAIELTRELLASRP